MATDAILPMYHQNPPDMHMDMSAFLAQEPNLQDDAFLQELLATQGDDHLASLLNPGTGILSPLTFDLDPQQHFPTSASPVESTGYHSDTNQSISPGGFSPSHSPLVSSTLPDVQPAVGSPFELGTFGDVGTLVDGSSTSPPPLSDHVRIDVDPRLSSSFPDRESASRESLCAAGGKAATGVVLSEEEKRLLAEEGITLPTDMPLTKDEQKHLKRIRRKIKNKISAQESRKRKKGYVDGLESRVKICTDRNRELKREVDCLKTENSSLLAQLRKLQAMVASYQAPTRVQTGTVLMVLVLSFSLFLVPQLKDMSLLKSGLGYGVNYQFSKGYGRPSRTLLFAETDQFGNVIDSESGQIISYAGGQSPPPLPPWVHQTPAVLYNHINTSVSLMAGLSQQDSRQTERDDV